MEPRKPAADRIRPILEAMERSIDSARRKRTLGDEPPAASSSVPPAAPQRDRVIGSGPSNPITAVPGPVATPGQPTDDPLRTETGERLKARPKRPQNLVMPHAHPLPPYQSRAG